MLELILYPTASALITTMCIGVYQLISKKHIESKDLCGWHRKNTKRLMYALEAVLDYIERDSVRHDIKLNGRYTRARKSIDKFIIENETGEED